MAIIEIKDKNNKNIAINTALIEHIEGTADISKTIEKGKVYSDDYTGNPKVAETDITYTMIDWNKNVKIVMLNGTTYEVPPAELQLLQQRGELGLRKRNPLGY